MRNWLILLLAGKRTVVLNAEIYGGLVIRPKNRPELLKNGSICNDPAQHPSAAITYLFKD